MRTYKRLIEEAATGVQQAGQQNGSKASKLLAGQVAGQLQQGSSFQYNPEQDAVLSAYKKMYKREGDRATADTLAKAASMTGGVPSSYAVTAATQAGNYHAAQMADKLPELEQTAYQRYINEEATRYDREQDAKNWQWQQEQFAYQKEQDAQDRAYQQQVLSYEQSQNAAQTAWDKAMTRFELLGYADKEIASVLGIPEGTKVPTTVETEVENETGTLSVMDTAILAGNTTNANKLLSSLKTMVGQMNNSTADGGNALVNSVVRHWTNGTINENEFAYMIYSLGLNPYDYMSEE